MLLIYSYDWNKKNCPVWDNFYDFNATDVEDSLSYQWVDACFFHLWDILYLCVLNLFYETNSHKAGLTVQYTCTVSLSQLTVSLIHSET